MVPQRKLLVLAAVLLGLVATAEASASHSPDRTRLVSGLQGSVGSTVGPDGALYVPEAVTGRIVRIDPRSGRVTEFASGLPVRVFGPGGATDIAFIGRTAYVLVTLVGPEPPVNGSHVAGLYRVDGRHRFTVVADIGSFAVANPPDADIFVPSGVYYAMERYGRGFLVTDGHHNRVYDVRLDGRVSERIAFGNVVPTGLDVAHRRVFMAEAGAVPHPPEEGKVVSFGRRGDAVREVAAGAPLLVDVELGRHGLYALSQGVFGGGDPGAPALPDTGSIVKADRHGAFRTVAGGLDRPTSFELIGHAAYVVTLTGEVWRLRG
jgi:hypothetical protein